MILDVDSSGTTLTLTFVDEVVIPNDILDLSRYRIVPSEPGAVPVGVKRIISIDYETIDEYEIRGVVLETNKPTNGKQYTATVGPFLTFSETPELFIASTAYTAVSSKPQVVSVDNLDSGQILITFSDDMRIDQALLDPREYAILYTPSLNALGSSQLSANASVVSGTLVPIARLLGESSFEAEPQFVNPQDRYPHQQTLASDVLVKTVTTLSPRKVLLTTVGLTYGDYRLVVNASGTPHDIAGNPMDPTFNSAIFSSSPTISSRSVFTDHGPITKPALTLQTGSTASITSPIQVTLPTAAILPEHVGLYLTLTGTTNAGTYKITARVSSTVVKVVASFTTPDVANGSISWRLFDPRDGQIADDPSDVVVRVNGFPVTPEAVIGLLGQVVLADVPSPTDTVDIDYSWIKNPVVDFRRLNSKEFRLNNWNRNTRRSGEFSHKYRFNNTLIRPASFAALDLRAELNQPQQRDLKYRAYERAYTATLNDPNLLLLNSPTHRIAFPPMSRTLSQTFVNYGATVLPEADPSPWIRHGVGLASIVGTELIVTDNTSGPFPSGEPLFWSKSIDLTFNHVFAIAWRMRITATPITEGVFTGVSAGYSDDQKAVIVGFLNDGGIKKIGIMKGGSGNDPSDLSAWTGGLDGTGTPTGAPIALDWSLIRSYRIFRDRSGSISLFVDGSVVADLKVASGDLPYLEELNAPFNELQGTFFGSLSRTAECTSAWSFVRYTIIPINPLQTAPSVYVSYEGSTTPENASQPWTPVGFHGTETIQGGATLLLDSTSASDVSAGLVGGDFRAYSRIEPLLSKSFDTVLDVKVQVRTYTHGIAPNAVMAAIDDGNRLMQLSFFPEAEAPKLSYGGRSLPEAFSPYMWNTLGSASEEMIGQYLQITDLNTLDGRVYFLDDAALFDDASRVLSYAYDYMFEFRVKVLAFTTDLVGFAGVTSYVYDSLRSVGLQLTEVLGQRYVELHSEGVLVVGGRFAFEWNDGAFHTYRVVKSTTGDLVSVFVDGTFVGSLPYSSFSVPAPSLTGLATFGSSTPLSMLSTSTTVWAYSNYWRVDPTVRKYVGLWKGTDSNSLTGYHLPLRTSGRQADIAGNALNDPEANFITSGVVVNDQIVIDSGPNKGFYKVASVSATQLTTTGAFPVAPAGVDYRVAYSVDWTASHRYRILKDPKGGVTVFKDTDTAPLIHANYSNLDLPPSSAGILQTLASGLPSITWGALDSTNLSQTSWDFVRYGAVRSISEMGIVPHHQVLNQRNVMASYEHHRTNIVHSHTDFWSESEGIPPQTEPDLLRDPNLVAFTLLNDSTPLVPSTQTYEVRSPTPVLVPVASLNSPEDVLNSQAFVLNNGERRIQIVVPDDVLYDHLQVIESTTGVSGILAPFDDESEPSFWPSDNPLSFQNTVCLTYDGTSLPENDTTAGSPWSRNSDDEAHQFESVFGGVLTYGTDSVGTRTVYRNPTPLPDAIGLQTEVKFRLKIQQDSTNGFGDSQVRVGFSSPGVTVGLAFVTSPLGERYVLVVDLNNGRTVGGIQFDFYDGAYHDYRLVRDPGSAMVQIFIDS